LIYPLTIALRVPIIAAVFALFCYCVCSPPIKLKIKYSYAMDWQDCNGADLNSFYVP